MLIYNWISLISAMISILNKYRLANRISEPVTPRRALRWPLRRRLHPLQPLLRIDPVGASAPRDGAADEGRPDQAGVDCEPRGRGPAVEQRDARRHLGSP